MNEKVKCKTKSMKLLEDNIQEMPHEICLDKELWYMSLNAQTTEAKTGKLHQRKKVLQSKGCNQQSEETSYIIGGSACRPFIQQRIAIQIYIRNSTQRKKKLNVLKQWENDLFRHFSLYIKELQVKATRRQHFIPVSMAIV